MHYCLGRDIDVAMADKEIDMVKDRLKLYREQVEEFHEKWHKEAKLLALKINIEESMPRTKRANCPASAPSEYYLRTLTIPMLGG